MNSEKKIAGKTVEELQQIEEEASRKILEGELYERHADAASTIPEHVYALLPATLGNAAANLSEWYERDVFLTALLGVLSGGLPNVRFKYGHQWYSTHLMFFIVAAAASGKGVMSHARRFLEPVNDRLLTESRDERHAWQAKRRAWETGEAAEDPGPEPPIRTLFAPDDTTMPALYSRLHTSPEGVIVWSTEADSTSNANAKEYGGQDSLFRKAFHHDPAEKETKTDGIILVPRPRVALIVSGTPGQYLPLIVSHENGLFSRVSPYYFRAPTRYRSQRPTSQHETFERCIKRGQEQARELYEMLERRLEPLPVEMPSELWDRLDITFDGIFRHLFDEQNAPASLAATMKRSPLIAYRIASILAVWRQFEAGADLRTARHVQIGSEDLDAALLLAQVYSEHGIRMAEKYINQGDKIDTRNMGGMHRMTDQQRQFYQALPGNTFRRKEAIETADVLGVPESTADTWLRKFVKLEMMHQPKYGQYSKGRLQSLQSLESLQSEGRAQSNDEANLTDFADFTDFTAGASPRGDGQAGPPLEPIEGTDGNARTETRAEEGGHYFFDPREEQTGRLLGVDGEYPFYKLEAENGRTWTADARHLEPAAV